MLQPFKVPIIEQFATIRHAKDLQCNCGHAVFSDSKTFTIIGYVDTAIGYMAVHECPKCFEQYRHHINTTGRYNLEEFKNDLKLKLHLQQSKKAG